MTANQMATRIKSLEAKINMLTRRVNRSASRTTMDHALAVWGRTLDDYNDILADHENRIQNMETLTSDL